MDLKRGVILLVFLLVIPLINSLTTSEPAAGTKEKINLQCGDGTFFGQCNDKGEVCATSQNLILNDRIALERNGRYVFFGFTNEICQDYRLYIDEEWVPLKYLRPLKYAHLEKGNRRLVADFLTYSNVFEGKASIKCDDGSRRISVYGAFIGKPSHISLVSDCGACGFCSGGSISLDIATRKKEYVAGERIYLTDKNLKRISVVGKSIDVPQINNPLNLDDTELIENFGRGFSSDFSVDLLGEAGLEPLEPNGYFVFFKGKSLLEKRIEYEKEGFNLDEINHKLIEDRDDIIERNIEIKEDVVKKLNSKESKINIFWVMILLIVIMVFAFAFLKFKTKNNFTFLLIFLGSLFLLFGGFRFTGSVVMDAPYDLDELLINEDIISFNGVVLNISLEDAEFLKEGLDDVENIYPNLPMFFFLDNSVDYTNAKQVWSLLDANGLAVTGKGIKIALIDSGVDYTHPDFGSCSTEEFLNGACEKVVGGYDFGQNDPDPIDDVIGHGTHVASTIAGNGVLKGVAPDAKIYAFKVSRGGSLSAATIMSAISRSFDLNDNGIPAESEEDRVDIISMSLGGYGTPDDPISTISNLAVENGVIVVVAAGNEGPSFDTVKSPSMAEKVISVGAAYNDNYGATLANIALDDGRVIEVDDVLTSNLEGDNLEIEGNLVYVDFGRKEDFTSDVSGKIVLMKMGEITFDDKIQNALDHGAKAAVIYNLDTFKRRKPKVDYFEIPSVLINEENAEYLLNKENSNVKLNLYKDIRRIAYFSSRGPNLDGYIKPEISAPGFNVCAAKIERLGDGNCIDNEHVVFSGTSMATPHVSGVAALLKQVHPEWSPEQIKAAIMNTAEDFGLNPNIQGSGLVDTLRAVTIDTLIIPGTVSFGVVSSRDTWGKSKGLKIENHASVSKTYVLSVNSNTENVAFDFPETITVDADSDRMFEFSINVDNNLLDEGEYFGNLFINDGSSVLRVPFYFFKKQLGISVDPERTNSLTSISVSSEHLRLKESPRVEITKSDNTKITLSDFTPDFVLFFGGRSRYKTYEIDDEGEYSVKAYSDEYLLESPQIKFFGDITPPELGISEDSDSEKIIFSSDEAFGNTYREFFESDVSRAPYKEFYNNRNGIVYRKTWENLLEKSFNDGITWLGDTEEISDQPVDSEDENRFNEFISQKKREAYGDYLSSAVDCDSFPRKFSEYNGWLYLLCFNEPKEKFIYYKTTDLRTWTDFPETSLDLIPFNLITNFYLFAENGILKVLWVNNWGSITNSDVLLTKLYDSGEFFNEKLIEDYPISGMWAYPEKNKIVLVYRIMLSGGSDIFQAIFGNNDFYYIYSDDFGGTWSEPTRLSKDPYSGQDLVISLLNNNFYFSWLSLSLGIDRSEKFQNYVRKGTSVSSTQTNPFGEVERLNVFEKDGFFEVMTNINEEGEYIFDIYALDTANNIGSSRKTLSIKYPESKMVNKGLNNIYGSLKITLEKYSEQNGNWRDYSTLLDLSESNAFFSIDPGESVYLSTILPPFIVPEWGDYKLVVEFEPAGSQSDPLVSEWEFRISEPPLTNYNERCNEIINCATPNQCKYVEENEGVCCPETDCVSDELECIDNDATYGNLFCDSGKFELLPGEICNDQIDNDRDGRYDCGDSDCKESEFCFEGVCNDRAETDNDGMVDCIDPDCFGSKYCEVCNDDIDNNNDNLVDCEDEKCSNSIFCSENLGCSEIESNACGSCSKEENRVCSNFGSCCRRKWDRTCVVLLMTSYEDMCVRSDISIGVYVTYKIKYDTADLSEVGGLSSEPVIEIRTDFPDIRLYENNDYTNKILIAGNGKAYYEDINNKVKFLKELNNFDISGSTSLGSIKDLGLVASYKKIDNVIQVSINSPLQDILYINFMIKNNKVNSLGQMRYFEEATELVYSPSGESAIDIGTNRGDYRTIYGTIIKNPKAHGSNDEVVLDIPE